MTSIDLNTTTITRLSQHIQKKEISPVEVIDIFLNRIEQAQEKLNPFITILDEQARQAAKKAEDEITKGRYRGPLHGIPFAAKDLFFTAGVKTTCGTRILADFVPNEDATVISRLVDAGAILIGKANMHEFAFGTTNLNPHYGNVRNPWNSDCVSGGSSGGSAVAVATGCALLALGTDTGGSIRIPAALCGIAAIKPTFGRISKHGVYPLCWSLDHPGPMTRTVADTAIALECLAGYDPKDPCSQSVRVGDYAAGLTGDIRGVRVGVPDTFYFDAIDPEVKAGVEAAIDRIRELGATVMPIHIPDLETAAAATLMILSAEAAACLEKFHRTRPDEIGKDVRERLDLGALHLAASYLKAQRIRRKVQRNFAEAFSRVDVLITPGVSIAAPRLSDNTVRVDEADIPVGVALTRCTRIFNLAGLPSVSVPVGLTESGLPIGMQVAGKAFDEATVLRVAEAYQRHIYQTEHWPDLS
ncbi:MAG: aspartyl/glutamyl-tRNA amidotransferase subunit A [Deltaproteobacteria bacterium]|nr:aspartyl/glutamyl-tRNA amidotransferase subunit A [Deltaproteobacteria bacterium]MBW2153709.1 aspartyl/glutamyl-tRNA amidotransferase subunit A [Deltaproteobacteria bacterium]